MGVQVKEYFVQDLDKIRSFCQNNDVWCKISVTEDYKPKLKGIVVVFEASIRNQ